MKKKCLKREERDNTLTHILFYKRDTVKNEQRKDDNEISQQ